MAASAVQKRLEKLGLLLSNSPVKTKVVQAANQIGKVVDQNPGPGLKTVFIPVRATNVAPGTVVSQKPGNGAKLAKGSTVYLYEAALPRIAYDTGTVIDVSSFGQSGPSAPPVAPPAGSAASEPTW